MKIICKVKKPEDVIIHVNTIIKSRIERIEREQIAETRSNASRALGNVKSELQSLMRTLEIMEFEGSKTD